MKRKINFLSILVVSSLLLLWGGLSTGHAQKNAGVAESAAKKADKVTGDTTMSQPVQLNGDNVEYMAEEGKFIASGNVVLKQNNSMLLCDRLEFFRDKQEAHANGQVVVVSEQGTIWADKGFYNFSTKKGEFTNARIMAKPFFGRAETISKISENYYVLSNGYLTTSDYDTPEWRVKSEHIEFYPNEKATARNSTLYFGGVPAMHFPKYTQSLRNDRPHFSVIPGYTKYFGPYVLTTYRTYPMEGLETIYHVDYREKKDLAWGVDVKYGAGKLGTGLLKTYYMNERSRDQYPWQDEEPPTTEKERYKVEWRHRLNVDPQTTAVVQYYKLSDSELLKDYFEKEYRQDAAPQTYFLLTRTLPYSSMSLRADVRVNRFETAVERLPELNYTLNNQQVGDTGFYFKSSNTLSRLEQKYPTPSDLHPGTTRFDTDNVFSRPFKVSFLEVTPNVGTEQTAYSRANAEKDDNSIRGIFKTGVDISTKFYRVYEAYFKKWGIEINKLRHVITPTVSYLYQHYPTMPSSKFVQFDAMDSRAKSDQILLGFENKLQTKRNGQSVDLFRSLFTTPYRVADDPAGEGFGDLTLTNEAYPNPYVTFHNEVTYSNDTHRVQSGSVDLYLKDNKRWEFDISDRYTQAPASSVTNFITTQLSYKFNPKWRTVVYGRWDAHSKNLLEQQYSFVRDLHSWEVEFAFSQKSHYQDAGSEVWVIFRLKAFPSTTVRSSSGFNKRKPGSQSTEE
ncbi:MAG: LPS-assembly protein LptD [Candidatus Omnitrophica bacterium]|nr:LPS-assembly protein LptD [Candidatus Omnitrophota bacterium]